MSKIVQDSKFDVCSEIRFKFIFDKNFKSLRNFLIYKFGDRTQAEDIAQKSFLILWENCERVSPEKAKSFLFKTAVRLNLNVIKHNKVVQDYRGGIQLDLIEKETPEFLYEKDELILRLEKAIHDLPEKQRVVFMMSRFENQTYKEISLILGLSVKGVERRMHLALLSLRKIIKNM